MKLLIILCAGLVLSPGGDGAAEEDQVVKGPRQPVFHPYSAMAAEMERQAPGSEYRCLYTGPALTPTGRRGQLVADLIVAGIAISPPTPGHSVVLKRSPRCHHDVDDLQRGSVCARPISRKELSDGRADQAPGRPQAEAAGVPATRQCRGEQHQ
jgi:hypothetical protein